MTRFSTSSKRGVNGAVQKTLVHSIERLPGGFSQFAGIGDNSNKAGR